jgi:hypothetical protein
MGEVGPNFVIQWHLQCRLLLCFCHNKNGAVGR